jgi:pseudolysin
MVLNRHWSLLILSCVMSCATLVEAAEPVALGQASFSDIKRLFSPQISGLLKASGQPQIDTLRLISQHEDHKHILHSRMQQYYEGYPVWGGYAILHDTQTAAGLWAKAKQSVSMNGVVYQNIKADLGKPPTDFLSRGAEALNHFKSQYSGQNVSDETLEPIVYLDASHRANWAYKVSVTLAYEDKIPERPTAIIDAKTEKPYVLWNDIKMSKSKVFGRGFGGNTHTGSHEFGNDIPKLNLLRDDELGICYMENAHAVVVDMNHRESGRNATMHFMCDENKRQSDGTFFTGYQNNGYDKINGAFSPSNDALYAGQVIYDMYKTWYGMYPIELSGRPKKLIMRVHFGRYYDNAFWDGRQMTFGDGGQEHYPLVSLGVSAHEISHGFTESHSNLMYFAQSGGMNESFSDMAAQAAEFFSLGTNSWMIGSEIVKEGSGKTAFRFMDKPSRDGESIDDASEYNDHLDVHHSSGVYNRLFYLLSHQPGWDVRRAFQVMLTANADYWTPTSTFDEGACGIIAATNSFGYSVTDVKASLDQVGVHYHGCT